MRTRPAQQCRLPQQQPGQRRKKIGCLPGQPTGEEAKRPEAAEANRAQLDTLLDEAEQQLAQTTFMVSPRCGSSQCIGVRARSVSVWRCVCMKGSSGCHCMRCPLACTWPADLPAAPLSCDHIDSQPPHTHTQAGSEYSIADVMLTPVVFRTGLVVSWVYPAILGPHLLAEG